MQIMRTTILAAAIAALPLAASWAQGSSDVQPQTQRAAVAGATTNSGSATGLSTSPTNGTAGGGMATESGKQAGGMAKQNKVLTGTAQQ